MHPVMFITTVSYRTRRTVIRTIGVWNYNNKPSCR